MCLLRVLSNHLPARLSVRPLITSRPNRCPTNAQVFGAAFRRNSRWSVNQPVPDLGDADAPMDKVGLNYLNSGGQGSC